MDRQEAIQTLSKVGKIPVSYAEDLYDSFFPFGSRDTCHTRKELEANGFGWVFDCEGVEVKEVE